MVRESTLLLALDLTGTFVFALNGALTAIEAARVDVVGVITLGVITAIGGGTIRDLLIGAVPPAAFQDWRYLAVAMGGGLVAFAGGQRLAKLTGIITVLDAAGLSMFAVTGATKALAFGLGAMPAVILGGVTAVGGGTIRDVLVQRLPSVLHSEGTLYAIPALAAAGIAVAADRGHVYGLPAALGAVAVCFGIRMLAVRYHVTAPVPRRGDPADPGGSESSGGAS
jgi:uncharacterized membrane protein YeiH